jgi:glycosyltransferase involved in cell wall biosynthesis
MKVSVLIATFNSAATIRSTLESVFQQSVQPAEVLVLDDGSTDATVHIVNSYKPRVSLLAGKHEGVASARNKLCQHARGDMVAFLDSDDIWHPAYLQYQLQLAREYRQTVATFTGHVDFQGTESFMWTKDPIKDRPEVELINSLDFFIRYNSATGTFGSMSYCLIPRRVLQYFGAEPFQTNGADDFYFFNRALLEGPIVYAPACLVAYRITSGSISSDRLVNYGQRVLAFEMLREEYAQVSDRRLRQVFDLAFASHRRLLSRFLMGAGHADEARTQLMLALRSSRHTRCIAKSFWWLCLTYLPASLQPTWPGRHRPSPRETPVTVF